MSASSRSSSPDPIVLPSSPLSARSLKRRRAPLLRRSMAAVSPSRTMLVDTPGTRGQSPWRIKVTVSAEPSKGTGSPVKRTLRSHTRELSVGQVETNVRDIKSRARKSPSKRTATPAHRRTRSQRTVEPDDAGTHDVVTSLPSERPAELRTQAQIAGSGMTSRTRQLNQARKEFNHAMREAVGSDAGQNSRSPSHPQSSESEVAGERTMANEDFTLISGASLASIKANNSILAPIVEIDKSYLSIDHSPIIPKVEEAAGVTEGNGVVYPDLRPQAIEAGSEAAEVPVTQLIQEHDPMSWRPTGPTTHISVPAKVQEQISEEEATFGAHEYDEDDGSDPGAHEGDMWFEEASRSLEREAQEEADREEHADFVPPIFSDEAQPPRRAKIPRTWRRTSGADFSYADSPAHVLATTDQQAVENLDVDRGSRHSSRVLTPPSTDDDKAQAHRRDDQIGDDTETHNNDIQGHEEIDLTHPDAAATQLEERHDHRGHERDVTSPMSDSSSNVTSPEGDDTGEFWQNNLPALYTRRPRRPRLNRRDDSVNLSEILHMSSTVDDNHSDNSKENDASLAGVEAVSAASTVGTAMAPSGTKTDTGIKRSPLRMRAVSGKIAVVEPRRADSQSLSSPLARSLLKSSKVGGAGPVARSGFLSSRGTATGGETLGEESFISHASDERQLLNETKDVRDRAVTSLREHRSNASDPRTSQSDEETEESDDSLEETEEVSKSYEEELNRESPQKVKVNFNDSSLHNTDSNLLRPTRQYAPLFERSTNIRPSAAEEHNKHNQRAESPPFVTLVSKRSAPVNTIDQQQPGVFNRLSTSFWSAVIRPSGPIYVDPQPEMAVPSSSRTSTTQVFPADLRARLRSRYGVLREEYPWTMAHMRTLHRMLNSVTSGKVDSIVPTRLSLPSQLLAIVDTNQLSVTNAAYTFTHEHACVVYAFMQVLVTRSLIASMQRREIEWLGDEIATHYRGFMGGRSGSEECFKTVSSPIGLIDWQWVVRSLGSAVCANEETERRRRLRMGVMMTR